MRSYVPVGWRGESYRHYLASKRIRTVLPKQYMGYAVKIVPEGKLHDYAAMNPEAAKVFGVRGLKSHEIWIASDVHDGERKRALIHEATEAELMKKGVPYWQAHEKALDAERRAYLAKKVDLKRYAGTWKQESVKNEPWFQKGCKDVKATYSLNKDGTVKVVNSCDGKKVEATARSVSADNRRLKVDFGFPFGEGDYNIKSVDPSYTRAVVRSGKTEWVLVR